MAAAQALIACEVAMATVLIIDDYPPNLVALECALEPLHHVFLRARSGREALELLATTDVALVLTDHYMGDVSGSELVHRVRASSRNQDVPIVLLSGAEGDETAIRSATSLPGVLFVQKPYRIESLRARVSELVPRGEAA